MPNDLQKARSQITGWLDVPRAEAVIVLGAIGLLILIRRGFRGVTIDLG